MAKYAEFRSLVEPIKQDYERAYGKSITENIPMLKGALNLYNPKKMWE